MIAHTMGIPFDAAGVGELCRKHGLWLIEDCCDALGTKLHGRHVGTFGDLATLSFYPAHHITMGEGGAVLTDDEQLARIARSFRDWGRDCYCTRRREQHLRQAVQPAVRHAALRLRPQVRLLARRLQPEGDRHSGGHRLRAVEEAAAVHRRAAAELGRAARGAGPLRRPPDPARNAAGQRAVLFRLRHHGARRRRLHPQRADGVPGSGQDRNPQPLLRQPDSPSRPTATSPAASSATWRTPTRS